MAMLDGLRSIFMQSLKFCKSKVAYDILVEKWNKECEEVYRYKQSLIAEEQVKHKPTADVVEVIRCKDCIHGHWNQETLFGRCIDFCDFTDLRIDKDHFCGYGERRTE